jgi:hypothetical protein
VIQVHSHLSSVCCCAVGPSRHCCFRRELAFARRLPNGQRVREWAEDALGTSPSYWTNVASQERELECSIQVLRHITHNAVIPVSIVCFDEAESVLDSAQGRLGVRLEICADPQPVDVSASREPQHHPVNNGRALELSFRSRVTLWQYRRFVTASNVALANGPADGRIWPFC